TPKVFNRNARSRFGFALLLRTLDVGRCVGFSCDCTRTNALNKSSANMRMNKAGCQLRRRIDSIFGRIELFPFPSACERFGQKDSHGEALNRQSFLQLRWIDCTRRRKLDALSAGAYAPSACPLMLLAQSLRSSARCARERSRRLSARKHISNAFNAFSLNSTLLSTWTANEPSPPPSE